MGGQPSIRPGRQRELRIVKRAQYGAAQRSAEQGFTLIEVLVASAILMTSIGVLMQLFASGLDRTARAGRMAHFLAAERTIAHRLEVINPAIQKRGKGVAEGVRYHWRSSRIAPLVPIYDAEGISRRKLGLFLLHITMQSDNNRQREFEMTLTGWTSPS